MLYQHMTDTNNTTLSDLTILSAIGEASRDNALSSCKDTSELLQGQAASNVANMASAERLGFSIDDNIDKQSIALREAIERNALGNLTAIDRVGTAGALSTDRNGRDNIKATERNASSVIRETGNIMTAQQAIANETRHILAINNTAAALAAKDIQLDICEQTGKLGLQSSENFGSLSSQVLDVKCKLEFQGAQNTAAIQLEALKNKMDLSAQLAECCCELKESVHSAAAQTQTVVREIESNRVRDALAAATTENLIARLRAPA
jgi:hypothetical protein